MVILSFMRIPNLTMGLNDSTYNLICDYFLRVGLLILSKNALCDYNACTYVLSDESTFIENQEK